MRHLNSGRKLGRTAAHRKALFNALLRSMVQYEFIQTTDAKAKELRGYADRLMTLAKRDNLHARRLAFAQLQDRALVAKLFNDLAKREILVSRTSGYTRIIKLGNRKGDNAPMSQIAWMGSNFENTETLRYPAHILAQFERVTEGDEEATEATDTAVESSEDKAE
jgi:large subunit ribosomal protein L17